MGQGYEDHLITPKDAIPNVDKVQWKRIDAQLCNVLWQSIDQKNLFHLRAYKTCSKFWNRAKVLYTNGLIYGFSVYENTLTNGMVWPSEIDLLYTKSSIH